jgi:hypothetical protein
VQTGTLPIMRSFHALCTKIKIMVIQSPTQKQKNAGQGISGILWDSVDACGQKGYK